MRFGRLTAIESVILKGRVRWRCICDCGNERVCQPGNIVRLRTVSCGCYIREVTSARSVKHGKDGTPIYHTWSSMKRRCLSPSVSSYKRYGGRGIKVCERWLEFANFYADMGDAPKGHSLDRIDSNGDYCPENCRWATYKEQAHNRVKPLEKWLWKDQMLCMAEIAIMEGLAAQAISLQIPRFQSFEDAVAAAKESQNEWRNGHRITIATKRRPLAQN